MKYSFKNLSIKEQLWILLGVFIVVAIASFFTLKSTFNTVEQVRVKVSTAEQLSFTSLKEAAENANFDNKSTLAPLQKKSKQNEQIINTFLKGGYLADSTTYSNALSGESANRLKDLKVLWDSVKHTINTIRFQKHSLDTIVQETIQVPNNDSLNTFRSEIQNKTVAIDNPEVVMAKDFVAENVQDLENKKVAFLDAIRQNLEDSKSRINFIIFFVVLINLAVFVAVVFIIRRIFLSQLQNLEHSISQINEGHFDIDINFEWKNEINSIGQKINGLTTKLRNATKFVKEVEKGELDAKLEGLDEKNINKNSLEAALVDMRDQMKKVEKEEEIRKWSTGGLAKFVDILRTSNDDVTELSDKIISNLVEYTHSNQGGLYLLNEENEEDKHLELISLYAFNQKKFEEQRYKLGEGLIGQTFLERKTTYLLEIPNEYIKITSGLGGANPKAILVVPLQVNKEIFGIIELASFEEYLDYEIEFVEKLGESIASTIAGVKNNQRTKKLLEESQELTEQMQAQEEEMRQNMEELSATQEEMARKEIEISAQITAINNTIGTVEYDSSGIITNTNAVFVKHMGYSTDELYDSDFKSIYNDEKEIWSQLKAGKSVEGNFTFKKADDSSISLETSFTPVYNDDDEVYKIIQLVIAFGTKASSQESDINQVETTLRQNLEELQITQEQLDKQLKYSEGKLEIIDTNVLYLTVNSDLEIIDANKAFTSIYGWSKNDVLGQKTEKILSADITKAINKNSNKVVSTFEGPDGREYNKEINIIYPDKEIFGDIKVLLLWV